MNHNEPNNLFELLDSLAKKGVKDQDRWKYIGPFLQKKARKLHIPISGSFELTPLCNFDCKMCYVHLGSDQFDKRNLLSLDQWKNIADMAKTAGMQSLTLTGGECLTYPDFDELYIYLISKKTKVSILSNGYLLDESKIKLFKEYEPSSIHISLYGSSEESYEAVTGVRAFHKVIDNIIRIKDAGFKLTIAITPSYYMRNDLEPTIRLAESLGAKVGINPQLMQPRENTGRERKDLTIDEYLRIYQLVSDLHHEERKPIDWKDIPEESHSETQRFGIRCGAGRSSFDIRYDGRMFPCLSLDEFSVKPLEIGFETAWKLINEYSEGYPIPLECGDCIYQRNCLSCVAVHQSAPQAGHCDPVVCERMKRLVKEGFIPLRNICKYPD